jgi:hypothetical protein
MNPIRNDLSGIYNFAGPDDLSKGFNINNFKNVFDVNEIGKIVIEITRDFLYKRIKWFKETRLLPLLDRHPEIDNSTFRKQHLLNPQLLSEYKSIYLYLFDKKKEEFRNGSESDNRKAKLYRLHMDIISYEYILEIIGKFSYNLNYLNIIEKGQQWHLLAQESASAYRYIYALNRIYQKKLSSLLDGADNYDQSYQRIIQCISNTEILLDFFEAVVTKLFPELAKYLLRISEMKLPVFLSSNTEEALEIFGVLGIEIDDNQLQEKSPDEDPQITYKYFN